ncbi:MAG: hypothetical protein U1F36_00720 [Planctomycetota bacterium]
MNRSFRVCAAAAALLATAIAQEPRLDVRADATEVALGERFGITVIRRTAVGDQLGAWDDRWLAPLTLRLRERSTRDVDGRREELSVFDAWAFRTGALELPVPPARPDDTALRLLVKSALPAGDDGRAELPGGLLLPPFPWLAWSLGALVALALGFTTRRVLHGRAAREVVVPEPVAAGPSALDRARVRLAVLAERPVEGIAAIDAFWVEASALLREYVEERFRLRAPEMTTEEFLASEATARVLGAGQMRALGAFLAECDMVKFAQAPSTAADCVRVIDVLSTFLAETARVAEGTS